MVWSRRGVDLCLEHMKRSAGAIDYADVVKDIAVREIDGVPIPFASPRLLWRMKAVTHRAKDEADPLFLHHWFDQRGEQPPKS